MAKDKRPAKGAETGPGEGGLKALFSAPRVAPHVVELSPDRGSPVDKRRIGAHSDVYLEISVLAFHHPEARKGLTKQVPLIFAEASWRRSKDTDLPQLTVMGPNPSAHPNMKAHGHYAFGGKTFFGPARFDGAVNFSLGLHLFKSNAAARTIIDVARVGAKMLPTGEMLILGKAIDGGIDAVLKGIKELLPDQQTPWLVGVIDSLPKAASQSFETGTWALIEGGGAAPENLYLDRHNNVLRDGKGKPLQKPYLVYSVNATETNPDRLRVGGIAKAYDRLREAFRGQANDAALAGRYRQFCDEVDFTDELTERDRDEIIADAKRLFERLMARRKAADFVFDEALFPEREVSTKALSPERAGKDEADVAREAEAAIADSLDALAKPDEIPDDAAFTAHLERLHTAVSDFAALVRSNPDEYRARAKEVGMKLRRRREFPALLDLATRVREGGAELGWLNYFGAFADIELNGVPSLEDLARTPDGAPPPQMVGEACLAKAIELAGPEREDDRALLSDCLGLQGRIWKMRAVRAEGVTDAVRLAFERSYTYYSEGAAIGEDAQFHRVNLLGLIKAAERKGIALGKKGEAAKWARDILKQMKKGGADSAWKHANAGDAALFLGKDAEAAKHYEAYLAAEKDHPFAVNTTRRQLVEVWGIDPAGNTAISALVRKMAQLSMRSMATVSMTPREIGALAQPSAPDEAELEAILDGVPAMPAADIRKVLKLAQSVGKVCAQNGRAVGTGFLLHGRHVHPVLANEYVFITNDHVVCDVKSYRGASVRSSEAIIRFEDLSGSEPFEVTEVFWRSESTVHDCAILRLSKQPQGLETEIEIADSLPFRQSTQAGQAAQSSPARAPRVYVVGHPNGRGLEITFEHNYIIDHELKNPAAKATPSPVRIHYRAPTEPGNSGSPVFSAASLKLIGLHHSTTDEPIGRPLKQGEAYKANEGLWIQAILAAVRAEKGEAPAAPPVISPAPAAAPAPKPAPTVATSGAIPLLARTEAITEGDEAALESLDSRSDTAETGFAFAEAGKLEAMGGAVAAFSALEPKPKARWAPLAEHPDTKHLAHIAINLNNGMSFQLTGAVLRKALENAATPVGGKWSRRVLFGIRGAVPKAEVRPTAPVTFQPGVLLSETEPDHVAYKCTMGIWDLDTDQLWVCRGSTVPAIGNVWYSVNGQSPDRLGQGCNMMAPGVYGHVVGTHANGGSTRQPGAFRQAAKLCVMRLASEELCFGKAIRWDTVSDANGPAIWDNIHAGLYAPKAWGAEHYSAGCQVLPGTVREKATRDTPEGNWAQFRVAAGLQPAPEIAPVPQGPGNPGGNPRVVQTTEDGQAFTYLLLTAREVRLAGENLDAAPGDPKFFKLRRGSQGDVVKRLQTALGLNPDGDFGYLTQRAVIERQLEVSGEADGVVTAANAASLGLQ